MCICVSRSISSLSVSLATNSNQSNCQQFGFAWPRLSLLRNITFICIKHGARYTVNRTCSKRGCFYIYAQILISTSTPEKSHNIRPLHVTRSMHVPRNLRNQSVITFFKRWLQRARRNGSATEIQTNSIRLLRNACYTRV